MQPQTVRILHEVTMSAPLVEKSSRTISGRLVVIAMFVMGLTATGLLFLYWNLHLMPFMPLQEAIVAEFKDSAPRVDGGRVRLHRRTPMMLRIVVRVDFDPTDSSETTCARLEHYMDRLRALAAAHTDLTAYEQLEVHFYQPVREKMIREHAIRRDLAIWQDVPSTETD